MIMVQTFTTRKIKIFGKDYSVFSESCCSKANKRTLYIDLLNLCNAKCAFCSAACHQITKPQILNLNDAKQVVLELLQAGAIDKISLTGGEPLIYPELEELLNFLDSLLEQGLEFYALTTNGIFLPDKIALLEKSKIKYINISRHHYDQVKNDDIFGIATLNQEQLQEIILKSQKNYRFNATITDDFNTKQDILSYIDFAKKIGVTHVLFRKEYKDGKNTEHINQLFETCSQCKKSTKCECKIKNINGINVEYRQVNVPLEQQNEEHGNYIRNFVLKHDNKLLGGWSEKSTRLY